MAELRLVGLLTEDLHHASHSLQGSHEVLNDPVKVDKNLCLDVHFLFHRAAPGYSRLVAPTYRQHFSFTLFLKLIRRPILRIQFDIYQTPVTTGEEGYTTKEKHMT